MNLDSLNRKYGIKEQSASAPFSGSKKSNFTKLNEKYGIGNEDVAQINDYIDVDADNRKMYLAKPTNTPTFNANALSSMQNVAPAQTVKPVSLNQFQQDQAMSLSPTVNRYNSQLAKQNAAKDFIQNTAIFPTTNPLEQAMHQQEQNQFAQNLQNKRNKAQTELDYMSKLAGTAVFNIDSYNAKKKEIEKYDTEIAKYILPTIPQTVAPMDVRDSALMDRRAEQYANQASAQTPENTARIADLRARQENLMQQKTELAMLLANTDPIEATEYVNQYKLVNDQLNIVNEQLFSDAAYVPETTNAEKIGNALDAANDWYANSAFGKAIGAKTTDMAKQQRENAKVIDQKSKIANAQKWATSKQGAFDDIGMAYDASLQNAENETATGVKRFFSDLTALGHGEDPDKVWADKQRAEYNPVSARNEKILSDITSKEENARGTLRGTAVELAQSAGANTPGYLLAPVSGIASAVTLATQMAASAYNEGRDEGASIGGAAFMALEQGLEEYVTDRIIGIAGGALGEGAIAKTQLAKNIKSAVMSAGKTPFAKAAIKFATTMASNGMGEYAQEFLQYFTENATKELALGKSDFKGNLKEDLAEANHAGWIGFLNALVMGAGGNTANAIAETKFINKLGKDSDMRIEAIEATLEALDTDKSHYNQEEYYKVNNLKDLLQDALKTYNKGKELSNYQKGSLEAAMNEVGNIAQYSETGLDEKGRPIETDSQEDAYYDNMAAEEAESSEAISERDQYVKDILTEAFDAETADAYLNGEEVNSQVNTFANEAYKTFDEENPTEANFAEEATEEKAIPLPKAESITDLVPDVAEFIGDRTDRKAILNDLQTRYGISANKANQLLQKVESRKVGTLNGQGEAVLHNEQPGNGQMGSGVGDGRVSEEGRTVETIKRVGRTSEEIADSDAGKFAVERRRADEVIKWAREGQDVYLAKEKTADVKEAEKIAGESNLKVWYGGELRDKAYGRPRRAYYDPITNEIGVIGDHEHYKPSQFVKHERMERRFRNGEANADGIFNAIAAEHPELAQLARGIYEACDSDIKELLCDAAAGINDLRYEGIEYEPMADVIDRFSKIARDYIADAVGNQQSNAEKTNAPKVAPRVQKVADKFVPKELYPNPKAESQFSTKLDGSLMDKAEKLNAREGDTYGHADEKALENVKAIRQYAVDRLNKLQRFLPADNPGQTIKSNGSYGRTIENSLICPRSIVSGSFMDEISTRIGRALSIDEQIIASQILANVTGEQTECTYCYVKNDRAKYRALFNAYYDSYADTWSKANKNKEAYRKSLNQGMSENNKLYMDFLDGRKNTKEMWSRYSYFIKDGIAGKKSIQLKDLATASTRNDAKNIKSKAWLAKDAEKWCKGAAWPTNTTRDVKVDGQKMALEFVSYNGSILNMKPDLVNYLNSEFGLRMYSDSDYTPHVILENIQMVTDAAVRGLKMLAYTKDAGFAKVFAPTGMAINVSVFGEYDAKTGKVNEDNMMGANWDEARALRKKYKNVGVVFVATNDDALRWALKESWIDVVIPFHTVRTGTEIAAAYDYTNYKGQQEDKKLGNWIKGDMKSIPPTVHGNSKAEYLAALEKNHLSPRFANYLGDPNYMKLVNETRMSYKDLSPVQPNFDLKTVTSEIDRIAKEGMYGMPLGVKSEEQLNELLEEPLNEATNKIGKVEHSTELDTKNLTKDTNNRTALAPTFFSKAQKEIANFKGDRIAAQSVEPYLTGKGVKAEEIKWSGIKTFLDGKKSVSKQELLDFMKSNQLEIKQKTLGTSNNWKDEYSGRTFSSKEEAIDAITRDVVKNWNESADPEDHITEGDVYVKENDGKLEFSVDYETVAEVSKADKTHWLEYKTEGGENYREYLYKMPNSNYSNSSMETHWGEPGVLAHARVQDFTTPDGDKVLFIDEIQSDWHNAGAKSGYGKSSTQRERNERFTNAKSKAVEMLAEEFRKLSSDEADYTNASKADLQVYVNIGDEELNNEYMPLFKKSFSDDTIDAILKAREAYQNLHISKTPEAPFSKNYTDFVLKSLLREASENGYDYLAWTTGKMQEDRWSSEFAEGYRIEYDQDIPKFLNKYGKQWGARVNEINIGDGSATKYIDSEDSYFSYTEEDLEDIAADYVSSESDDGNELTYQISKDDDSITITYYDEDGEIYEEQVLERDQASNPTVPAIPVTDSMRESVLYEGQPMFSEKLNASKLKSEDLVKEYNKLSKESAAKDEKIAVLSKAMADIDYAPNTQAIRKIAKELKSAMPSTTMKNGDIEQRLSKIYQAVRNSRDGSEIYNLEKSLAEDIINNGGMGYSEEDLNRWNSFRDKLKTIKLQPSEELIAEMGGEEDFRDWYRSNFPNVIVSKNGMPMDKFYEALNEWDSSEFPEGMNHIDAFNLLREKLVELKPKARIEGMSAETYGEYVENLVDTINDAYFSNRFTPGSLKIAENALKNEYKKATEAYKAELRAKAQATEDKRTAKRERYELMQDVLKRARRLNRMKGDAEFRAAKEAILGDLDLVAPGIRKDTEQKLRDLRDQVDAQALLDPDYAALKRPKYDELFKRIEKKHLNELSNDELAELNQAILDLEHSKRTYDREIKEDRGRLMGEMGRMAVKQQQNVPKIINKTLLDTKKGQYPLYMLNPTRAFEMLDGYDPNGLLTYFGKEFNDGQTKEAEFKMRAEKEFEAINNNKELIKDFAEPTIDIGNGIKISKGMRISLYLHSLNRQNLEHIAKGGFKVPNAELYAKGDYSRAYARGTRVKLQPSQVKAIIANMTPGEKEYAKIAQHFFNVTTKEAINKTSMLLDGYEKAIVDNYFPIKTDSNFTQTKIEGLVKDATIEGMGSLKERQEGASNPIMLEDVSQVVLRQTNNTAKYYGLAIPVRNWNKFYNYQAKGYSTSFREALEQAWPGIGKKYVENVVSDLQTPRKADRDILDKAKSLYAGSVLNMNLGVAIKQSASYPFAAAEIGWTPLVKALKNTFSKADYDYMDSITPWSYMRRVGLSGTPTGEVAKQRTTIEQNTTFQKVKRKLDWIRMVDVKTTDVLFFAAEEYVKEKYPKLEVRGEEYNKKVAETYNNVLQKTQPSYDVMQRNEYLRSTGSISRVLGMFKTQTFNMGGEIIDAYYKARSLNKLAKEDVSYKGMSKEANKHLANVGLATVASQVMLTALTVAANAVLHKMKPYRDEETGELTKDSLEAKFMEDFLTSFAGMFIGGSEIQDAVRAFSGKENWYDITYPGLDAINDFVSSVIDFKDTLKGDDSAKKLKKGGTLGLNALDAFGLPATNIYNIFNAANLWVQDFINEELGTFNAGKGILGITDTSPTGKQYAKQAVNAFEVGNQNKGVKMLKKASDTQVQAAIGAESSKNADGETINGSKQANTIDEILAYDCDNNAKGKLYAAAYPSDKLDEWVSRGNKEYDFMMAQRYFYDCKGDGKQEKIIEYIKKQPQGQWKQLWGLAGYSESTYEEKMLGKKKEKKSKDDSKVKPLAKSEEKTESTSGSEPQTVSVESSNVRELTYNDKNHSLIVKFNSGTYRYDGVPKDVYEELIKSGSIGGYLSQNIKNNYDYTRL